MATVSDGIFCCRCDAVCSLELLDESGFVRFRRLLAVTVVWLCDVLIVC